jgi:hypothetical protein
MPRKMGFEYSPRLLGAIGNSTLVHNEGFVTFLIFGFLVKFEDHVSPGEV